MRHWGLLAVILRPTVIDLRLTGRENLVLVAKLRHLPDAGKVADDLLATFRLTDAGARKVGTYSGGMRRRLDIAMSLVGHPEVIYLDEPTTGLDPEARIEVWGVVKELANTGTTVLLTTQYLDEAEHLADRIAILHEGRIIAGGTLAELKKLLPAAKVEYALRRRHGDTHRPLHAAHLPQPRHDHHHGGHPDRADAPLRLRLRRCAPAEHRHRQLRELPAPRHPAHRDRLGHRVHGVPAVHRHAERHLRAVPLHADRACCGRTCSRR